MVTVPFRRSDGLIILQRHHFGKLFKSAFMCRLLGYLGSPIQLHQLLYNTEHSLIVQSYQPREMTAGLLNADGFGLGWYHSTKSDLPYIYKNILPIWTDINLPHLSRYVESGCLLAYVRSATPPLAVDFSNCQPFSHQQLLFIHNGFISNFRDTVYRPIRNSLDDDIYRAITGTTDSEHIFGLILQNLAASCSLKVALSKALKYLSQLANEYQIKFSANVVLSDGKELVASRYAYNAPTPSLYCLKAEADSGVMITSEPLFPGNWQSCPENSIITVKSNLEIQMSLLEI